DMRQVCFDGIHGSPAAAIGIIDAHLPEQGVGGITEHLKVTRVGHVSVVVEPFGADLDLDQPQWGVNLAGRPPDAAAGRGRALLVQAFLECPERGPRADVMPAQRLLDVYQALIPEPLELTDRAATRLGLRTLDHAVDQPLRELRRLEFRPGPFQTGTELFEHMAHARLTPGQMVDEVRAHGPPAQSGPIDDRLV